MWRQSLGTTAAEDTAVKLFTAPDEYDLDALPDDVVFVLRGLLPFERALPEDLTNATMLAPADVADALRHGLAHGYRSRSGDR